MIYVLPEYSLSSWPFYGWSGRSPAGTTAATGRRRRSMWCCVSAASRSTSSWTSSTSSSPTRGSRSVQTPQSGTRASRVVLVSVVCNPHQEPRQLRVKEWGLIQQQPGLNGRVSHVRLTCVILPVCTCLFA